MSISAIRWTDPQARRLTCPIVVLGAGAGAFAARVSDGLAQGGEGVELQDGSSRHRVALPPIRDFEAAAELFVLPSADARLDEVFWRHLPHTRWLVLSTPGPSADRTWVRLVEPLTRVLDAQRGDVAVALHGESSLRTPWDAYGGPVPLVIADDAVAVFKTTLRHFVKSVRSAFAP